MAKTNLEKMKEIVEKLGEDYSVYENYSGRFMFGKKCLGIVGPNVEAIKSAASKKGFKRASIDNMGLNMIIYWPHIQ